MIIKSFDPVISSSCTKIILGTMPGKTSLKKKQYYGHGGNRFWEVIAKIFGSDKKDAYPLKCSTLLANGIALWDVLESCERKNSSDKNIINPTLNNFEDFFLSYPKIKQIIFNGTPPSEFYNSMVKNDFGKQIAVSLTTSPWSRVLYKDDYYFDSWRQILK